MLALKGKTILITRAAAQAEDFIIQLNELGAKTISLPLIKNTASNQTELVTLFNSQKYDWLIFTSTNAVQFFFESIAPKDINCKIAVVGEKTKKALSAIGLPTTFVPSQYTAKQLAKELPVSKNDSILIPRSDLAKNRSVEILEARECLVKTISIYSNSAINYSKLELANIFHQQIDFITFTSSSTVDSFIKLGICLKNERTICIGPETAKTAKENNLQVSAIANPHTIKGMITAIRNLVK
jgi:uroporphyrinogen-III synthase